MASRNPESETESDFDKAYRLLSQILKTHLLDGADSHRQALVERQQ
jgi:hypothetical protein